MRKLIITLGVLCAVGMIAPSAQAIPALQIYIEGATYDDVTDTWVLSGSGSFRLWVIGDVGSYGTISDVKLSAAYATSESGSVTLAGSTTGGYGGVVDSSTSSAPVATAGGGDGAVPLLTDSSPLPSHGIYGAGTSFLEWQLGNFTLTDSAVGDFNGALPFPTSFPSTGQINVYDVTVTGYTSLHFDAYDNIGASPHVKYVNAPFSHDGEGAVPVPGAALLGLIGFGLVGAARRRFA